MSAPSTIRIADIDVSGRRRPINPDLVEYYAASIEDRGLLQPIVVGQQSGERPYRLNIGGHRLQAMIVLDRQELVVGREVIIREARPDDGEGVGMRIDEIDENLVRANLTALDRALHLADRKRLHQQREGVDGHGGDRRSKTRQHADAIKAQSLRLGFSPRFTEEAAARVGLSERAIQLAISIADRLDPTTIPLLLGTPIEDNQRELIALAEQPAAQQRKVAAAIRDGHAKTVGQARVHVGIDKPVPVDPEARIYAALLENWERASRQTRTAFLKEIDAQLVSKKGGAK